MSSCASYVSCTHDVIHNVARSQIKSKFEIAISPSISELKRRSKAKNIRTANGYLSDTFNFRHTSGKKVCRELNRAAIFKMLRYQIQLQFVLGHEKIDPNYTRQFFCDYVIDDVTGWPPIWPSTFLCERNKNIFHDSQQQTKISSLNLMYICIIRLWLHLYKFVFMTLLMTSSGP